MPPEAMETVIRSLGREPWQRTTLYRDAPLDRVAASFGAPPLAPTVETPVRKGSEWRMASGE
jgi:FO synthase